MCPCGQGAMTVISVRTPVARSAAKVGRMAPVLVMCVTSVLSGVPDVEGERRRRVGARGRGYRHAVGAGSTEADVAHDVAGRQDAHGDGRQADVRRSQRHVGGGDLRCTATLGLDEGDVHLLSPILVGSMDSRTV